MAAHMAVVVSQGQSDHPARRRLEEAIVAELVMDARCDVIVVPHLYDLTPDSSALVALQALKGDFVVLSWLYPRAAHWTLDLHHVRGRLGETVLESARDERTKKREQKAQEPGPEASAARVIDRRPGPDRTIYHLDLRTQEQPRVFIDEVKRLAAERSQRVVNRLVDLGGPERAAEAPPAAAAAASQEAGKAPARRWYPVIDYSRCTNCMECIDFCLFGVYGIDHQETILVEQPDNCRKGCPACSRVCPENAIIFPLHKTPAIAGDPSSGGEVKIDLSQLFGKPTDLDLALRERDEQLQLSGREAVGIPTDVADHSSSPASPEHDELDKLIDELDQMDL